MHPRVAHEWSELVAFHRDIKHAEDPERVLLDLELPESLYSVSSTPALVVIPPPYPTTPLDGFLVPHGVTFAGGGALPLTGDGSVVGLAGWQLVSFHLVDDQGRSTWRPTANPERGDNLVGYIASIESFLARGCQ